MRDPNRIDRILGLISEYWKSHQAFNNIPKEYLLPWSCSDLELKKANQQPRSAYKCEPCKVSVSGKPEQLIKCGNCGNDLLELVKVPNGI